MTDSQFYHQARSALHTGDMDMTANLKLALVNGYTPDLEAHALWSDVSTHEITGDGYDPGGSILSGLSLTRSGATVTWAASPLLWPAITATISHAVIYQTDAPQRLLAVMAFDCASGSVTLEHQALRISWSASLHLTPPALAVPRVAYPVGGQVFRLDHTFESTDFALLTGTDTHAASRWQIEQAGTVINDSGTTTAHLTTYPSPYADLIPEAPHRVRVQHQGQTLGWSPWGWWQPFLAGPQVVTRPSITAPTPGQTVTTTTGGSVTFTASTFISTIPGDTHHATRWRVLQGATEIHDSGITTSHLTTYAAFLEPGEYTVQAQYQGTVSPQEWSEWSQAVAFERVLGTALYAVQSLGYYNGRAIRIDPETLDVAAATFTPSPASYVSRPVVFGDHVYVLTYYGVVKLDAETLEQQSVLSIPDSFMPMDMAFNQHGYLYISSQKTGHGRVWQIDPETMSFVGDDPSTIPPGSAPTYRWYFDMATDGAPGWSGDNRLGSVTSIGDSVFVAGLNTNLLIRLDAWTMEHSATLVFDGSTAPSTLTADEGGTLYALRLNRVFKLDATTLGISAESPAAISTPFDITSGDGHVYTASHDYQIRRIRTSDMVQVAAYTHPTSQQAQAVAYDSAAGYVYAAYTDRLVKLDAETMTLIAESVLADNTYEGAGIGRVLGFSG